MCKILNTLFSMFQFCFNFSLKTCSWWPGVRENCRQTRLPVRRASNQGKCSAVGIFQTVVLVFVHFRAVRHDSRREIITCLFGRTIRAQLQPCQFVPTKLMIYYRPIKHFIWNNFIILFTKQSSQKTKLKKTRKSTLWSVYYRQSLIKRP